MAKPIFCLLLAASIFVTAGCDSPPDPGKGFTLPEGDVEAGKASYVSLQCNACHQIEGIAQIAEDGKEPELSIALGGPDTRIKTHGELVASIINPSHRLAKGYPVDAVSVDGKSKMSNYNDVMTVTQLVDLVTFLESKYTLLVYFRTDYPLYHDLPL